MGTHDKKKSQAEEKKIHNVEDDYKKESIQLSQNITHRSPKNSHNFLSPQKSRTASFGPDQTKFGSQSLADTTIIHQSD